MLPAVLEDLIWSFHEYYPKDSLHKELRGLAYGGRRGAYYHYDIFSHSVFLDLPIRWCWPVRYHRSRSVMAAYKRRFEWTGDNVIYRIGRTPSFRLV